METIKESDFVCQPIGNSLLGTILKSVTYKLNIQPSDSTLADKLIYALDKAKFISEIESLTKEVVVHTKVKEPEEHGRVYAYEVLIVLEKSELVVKKQDPIKWEEFLQTNRHDEVRVILIKSDSLPIVEAKFEVYKALRDHINSGNMFLHHVMEEYDEIAKLSFHRKLSYFSGKILDLSNNIPIASLTTIITEAAENVFIHRKIRNLCHSAMIRYDGEDVGTADDRSYVCYSMFTVTKLKKCLVEETLKKIGDSLASEICTGILRDIESKVKSELKKDLIHLKVELTKELLASISLIVMLAISVFISAWLNLLVAMGTFFVTLVMPIDVNSYTWRNKVADEIWGNIRDNRCAIFNKVLLDVEKLCRKTSSDLENVAKSLQAYQREIQLVNQKQSVAMWEKRKGMHVEDRALLQKHPNILKCIAGYNGNKKQVLKVFIRGKDPAKYQKGKRKTPETFDQSDILQIKKVFGDLQDFQYEIVYVDTKAEEIRKQAQKIKLNEKDSPCIDDSTGMKLGQIIQKHCDKIHASYSNVIGIGMSQVRIDGNAIKKEPCIVLYCLDKGIIPFGEKPLPEKLEGIHCDQREDFVMFGMCPNPCPAFDRDLPVPGCCIGTLSKKSSGSVGFVVKQRNVNNQTNRGFLTASHVALEDFEDLYDKGFLSQQKPDYNNLKIIHPLLEDGVGDNVVGRVVESFIGNYIYTIEDHKDAERKEGLDFALVTTSIRSEESHLATD